jgi:hypothetical protein
MRTKRGAEKVMATLNFDYVETLESAWAFHVQQAEKLGQALRLLKGAPTATSSKYQKLKISDALELYLHDCKGSAKVGDCVQSLLDGGCDMGGRPESNMKTAVSMNRGRFEMREGVIYLCDLNENQRAA